MARKSDLTSLATLAGLAYLASRDRAAKGDKGSKVPVEDRTPTPTASASMEDTEFGDLEGAQRRAALVPDRAPVTPSAAPTRAPRESSPSIVDQETGMRAYKPRYTPPPQGISTTEEGMRGYKPRYTPPGRAPKAVAGERPSPRLNAQELDDYTTYKKGGSVKGWGIARGARKAKNY